MEKIISWNNFFRKDEKLNDILDKPRINSLTFTDFDDTLVSRLPQFKSDKRFIENRWEKWVDLVMNVIWLENFLGKYYNWKDVILDILNKTDIILTAWKTELQQWKLQYTWINKESVIVEKHSMKPKAMLDYIVNNVWAIPESITFIDDKAFKLEKEFQELSKILQTKIILQNIKIDEKDYTKKYEITEKIYENWEKVFYENWQDFRIFNESEK